MNDIIKTTATASLEKVKGDIVTQTLGKLNGPGKTKKSTSSMSDTFQLSQSVLGAAYTGKGTILDKTR